MQTREETNTEASLLITPLAGHDGWQKITFSTRRGERVYSRKCAFHVLLINSATYAECALYCVLEFCSCCQFFAITRSGGDRGLRNFG